MCCDVDGVVGVVVEEGQDFGIGVVVEVIVVEVGLLVFVGQVGFEVDVGGFWLFFWFGFDQVGVFQGVLDG